MVIPEDVRRALTDHAREALPNEACGVLVLRDATAVRYVPGRNRAASPYRFELEVDPEVWFLEDDGYQLAVVHSHPASPAHPSRTDVENIGLWEDRPYLIYSVRTDELAEFRIRDGRIHVTDRPSGGV